jgi:hypothetical protein
MGKQGNQRLQAFFQIGEEAAESFQFFLRERSEWTLPEAAEWFYRISFDWNVEGDCPERRLFVEAARTAFKNSGTGAVREGLELGVREYSNSLQARDLVKFIPADNRFI